MFQKKKASIFLLLSSVITLTLTMSMGITQGADLPEIKQRGVLRHLGVPYAKFVTGSGDGLDVELIKLFAKHLGVRYEYVETNWKQVIGDLTGKKVQPMGDNIDILGDVPVRGDMIANGLTILPWRQKIIDYSDPTFPSGVWLIARADSSLRPIVPSGDIAVDINAVKAMLNHRSVLAASNTCLDPKLYALPETGAQVRLFEGLLDEMAPALLNEEAETSLLDVPDAMVAIEKWPGKIKVIGPISKTQQMGCGFAKTSMKLRAAFNRFFEQCRKDGTYVKLIHKYYPLAASYFPDFFKAYNFQ